MSEVEKKSCIALPDKGDHSRLIPSKLCPNQGGGSSEESYGPGAELLITIRVHAGPALLQSRDLPASGSDLWFFVVVQSLSCCDSL